MESGKHLEMLQFVSILLMGGRGGGGDNEGNYYKVSGKPLTEAIFVLIVKSFPRHFVRDCS